MLAKGLGKSISRVTKKSIVLLKNERGSFNPFFNIEVKNKKGNLDLSNALMFKKYIRDIEKQMSRSIPFNQRNALKNNLKENKYTKLNQTEHALHRKEFSKKRLNLIDEWEKNTNQTWPRYNEIVYNSEGKVLKYPNYRYDAHEIIVNQYGGPLEWWNIHPARFPNEHQDGDKYSFFFHEYNIKSGEIYEFTYMGRTSYIVDAKKSTNLINQENSLTVRRNCGLFIVQIITQIKGMHLLLLKL